ncbi:tetratricopeptide repeat protein [Calderihabitans maritimus]|uniref:Uncharacterized protein n=1 Tax=Calderihabitans maritimus TaxID=1246530 RepID=A0A1Z5HTS9_9FIRM|nr:tetratricopeptide repeat protein [Calderihabitans maritimus]GAW92946.1 hypothetical protein KKC1_20910 [Calderihabitans maritimus]
MSCPYCQFPGTGSSRFCPKCGHRLTIPLPSEEEINLSQSRYHNALGNSYFLQGLWGLASIFYQKAINISPELWQSHYNLGCIYYRQGNLSSAEHHFRRVLELQSNYYPARYNLGTIYLKQKHYIKALENLVVVKKQVPYFWPNRLNLAATYYCLGLYQAALEEYLAVHRHNLCQEEALKGIKLTCQKLGLKPSTLISSR